MDQLDSTHLPPIKSSSVTPTLIPPDDSSLAAIDDELRTLHRHCLKQGYSPCVIGRGSVELFARVKSVRRRGWIRRMVWGAMLVAFVGALTQCDPVYRAVCVYLRIATIKLLPYWDWTVYYNNGCLLENPFYEGTSQENLLEEDCNVCEHLEPMRRVSNVTQSLMTTNYIKRDIPVVVTDALIDWPAQKLFSLQFLYELYTTDDVFKRTPPCMFASNVALGPGGAGGARAFLSLAYRGELSQWYAHWETCERQSVRVLRQFYRRPYFLPAMVEVADRSWILTSSHYSAKNYKPMDLATPLMWLVQLRGANKLRLVPRAPCNATCSTMYATLHEGDMLVWTDFMWLVDYKPVSLGSQLNVAILAGGYFD